ncbi:hypothetical protein CAPTEDRAFT_203771 [Capitella teleta]|uniref:Uncharacterized protein n=1 Tax=Capitella teleta TaxID=283909 RepID=R7TRK5_CAPTE|nr:hypothetical protein CAPTEDRAFT_203771 [Capitella teleta]|eukprot:ELT96548.1 hypothetical protein CAPTEDRAFT_203771 [Capitella teleta]
MWDIWSGAVSHLLEQYVPKVTINTTSDSPWIDGEARHAINRKRTAWRRVKRLMTEAWCSSVPFMSPEQCLHKALRQNDRNAVREILNEAKVNINGLYYGMTPLMVAVSKGYTEAALTLLDKGADSAIRDVDGSSVFEQAVLKNQVQVVKRLVKRNIFLNEKLKNGHTALTYSAQKKHSALTEVLVDGDVIQA